MADEQKPKDGGDELEALGKEMEEALEKMGEKVPPPEVAASGAAPGEPKQDPGTGGAESGSVSLSDENSSGPTSEQLNYILDIPFDVTVEVGRTDMLVKDIIALGQGSVIELSRLSGEYLDVLINGRIIAKGEVVVVNDKFGLRLKKIVSPMERIEMLR